MLNALCERAELALIGIGSANRYDVRNPFTVDEVSEMIRLALPDRDNYQLMPVPDLDDGPLWRAMIIEMFGELDVFVTGNPYVASLLGDTYPVIHPVTLLPPEKQVAISGSMVRLALAKGEAWQEMVLPAVATYIEENQLDDRFRREFGLETLTLESLIKSKGNT